MTLNLDQNVVISSRIRFARNFKDFKFVNSLTKEECNKIINSVSKVLMDFDNFDLYLSQKTPPVLLNSFLEKHYVSKEFLQNKDKSALLLNPSKTISVMINEEDHLRVQSIVPSHDLEKAFLQANLIDNLIDKNLVYAFDEKLGYLTCCPTNLGTGMRASVMMFLPGFSLLHKMNELLNAASQLKIEIRGLYGEGSDPSGYTYQISNKTSLGLSEEQIIKNVNDFVNKIKSWEMQHREKLFKANEDELKNNIHRSFGLLTNSHMVSYKELIENLILIRIGISLKLLKCDDMEILNNTLDNLKPYSIMSASDTHLSEKDIEKYRAEKIKKILMKQVFTN